MKTTEFGMFAHAPMSGETAAYLPKRATRPGFLRPGSRSYGLLAAAGLGALSLLDPSEGDARERRTVNRIIAAATGVYGAAELRSAMDVGALAAGVTPRLTTRLRNGLVGLAGGAAAGGLVALAPAVYAKWDATSMDLLEKVGATGLAQKAGLTHPRAAMAVLGVAAALLGNAAARRTHRDAVQQGALLRFMDDMPEDEDGLAPVPVPAAARVLLETLLDPALAEGAALPGQAALRAQLAHTKAVEQEPGVEFTDWLPLVVDAETPLVRAVPHDFTWPVRGRFTHEGQEFEVRLCVVDGELGALVVEPVDQDSDDAWQARATLESWPSPEELAFAVDGAEG